MKVLTTITPRFRSLVDRWLAPSLRRLGHAADLEVHVDRSRRSRGSGDFRTPGFDQHVFNKLTLIAAWAGRETEPFLVTDADVIYLRPFAPVVGELMEGTDLLLAREYPGRTDVYNIGQMVLRPGPEVARFFERVAADLRGGAGSAFNEVQSANQEHLNEVLRASALRHGALPETFANTGLWGHLGPDRHRTVVSYHATETFPVPGRTSLEQKHERLAGVAHECGVELRRRPFGLRRRTP